MIDSDDFGQELLADSAFIGKGVKKVMRKFNMKDSIIKWAVKVEKLSKHQTTVNKKDSKTRVQVEYVFGYYEQSIHGVFSRAVGFLRKSAQITLMNLVYNLNRYEQIVRLGTNS